MDIFDVLTLIGGLCLFLFGMNVMGQALERSAGSRLELMLGKLTTGKIKELLTGLGARKEGRERMFSALFSVGRRHAKAVPALRQFLIFRARYYFLSVG